MAISFPDKTATPAPQRGELMLARGAKYLCFSVMGPFFKLPFSDAGPEND